MKTFGSELETVARENPIGAMIAALALGSSDWAGQQRADLNARLTGASACMLLAFPVALRALYLFAEPLELAASSIIQRHMHFSRSNKMAFECINPYSHRGKTFADCSTVEIKRLHLLWWIP